jgi:hypothetical protein
MSMRRAETIKTLFFEVSENGSLDFSKAINFNEKLKTKTIYFKTCEKYFPDKV